MEKFLKGIEIDEELKSKILKEHNKALSKYNDYEEIKASYKAQGEELEKLRRLDPAKLQDKIKELTESHNKKMLETEERYNNNIKRIAVKSQLTDAHDSDLVTNLIDMNLITIDNEGNVLTGLNDQLELIKKDKAFLFKGAEPQPVQGTTPHNSTPTRQPAQDTQEDSFFKAFEKHLGL